MYHLLKMLKIYISWHIFYMSEKMCIGLMFGSSLPPVVYRRAHVLFTLFVLFVYIVLSNTYCVVLCFCFVFLRLVYPMLPVSLDCPFFLPLRYSLTFI